MNDNSGNSGQLKRTLKQRHLTMIAIGGSIGTALFLSTGFAVNQGGPGGIVLAYCLVAIMIFFIVMSLGEMATDLPCSGSFQTYTSMYVSPSFGLAIGWTYWFSWAITVGIEVIASAIIMSYWFPGVPGWIWSLAFCFVVVGLNLLSAKAYGEAEFWFASIKVFAVVSFLIVGVAMMLGVLGNEPNAPALGFSNFTESEGGLFPHGIGATLTVAFTAVFCFLGTEIVGVAAGESDDPQKAVPKAIRTVFVRIAIFYIGATFMVAALIPWQDGTVNVSPFTLIFDKIGIPFAGTIMNIVVLTSTLSCANAGLYSSSRMIYSMAKEGKAPAIFSKVNKRGVPVPALLLTALMGGGALLSRFMSPSQVYLLLVSASSLAILFAWIGICVSHYKFRKAELPKRGMKAKDLKFKAPFFPAGPIIATIMCVVVIVSQIFGETTRPAAIVVISAFLILLAWGAWKQKKGMLKVPTVEEVRKQSEKSKAEKANEA